MFPFVVKYCSRSCSVVRPVDMTTACDIICHRLSLFLYCRVRSVVCCFRSGFSGFLCMLYALATEYAVHYQRHRSVARHVACRAETVHGYVQRNHQRLVLFAESQY